MKQWTKQGAETHGPMLLICCIITFGCYTASFLRLPVVPLYAREFGTTTSQIGVINAAFYLMAGLFSFPMGMVSDRIGSKPAAAAGVFILAAASFSLGLCDTFSKLVIAYLFLGVGLAAFGPTMMAFVAQISPSTHLGRSYGWYTTAIFCGMSFGPATGGFIAQRIGFVSAFATAGGLLLVVLAGLIFLLPEKTDAEAESSAVANRLAALKGLFRNHLLVGCWGVALGISISMGMFTSFIPLHAQNHSLDAAMIGLVFFAQGLANGLSRIPFGQLSDRVPRRSRLVVVGACVVAVSMAGLGGATHTVLFLAFAVVMGVGMGLAFTSIGALIAESAPPSLRGVAMGGYNTCIYLGMMIASAFMGPVNQSLGFPAGFAIIALVNALCAVLFFFIARAVETP